MAKDTKPTVKHPDQRAFISARLTALDMNPGQLRDALEADGCPKNWRTVYGYCGGTTRVPAEVLPSLSKVLCLDVDGAKRLAKVCGYAGVLETLQEARSTDDEAA